MYLIIGLGNPGSKYERTRHNVGFLVIGEFADKYNLKLKNYPKFQSYISEMKIGEEKCILAMPLTYMNNSGITASRLANFYKVEMENIIIIHDDIDLPFGKIRISCNSSHGGHNGIRSIIGELGGKNFIRLRIGIANELLEEKKIPSEKFVLSNFSKEETKHFISEKDKYIDAVEAIVQGGYEKAMGEWN